MSLEKDLIAVLSGKDQRDKITFLIRKRYKVVWTAITLTLEIFMQQ